MTSTISKSESKAICNLILAASAAPVVSPRQARRAARTEKRSLNLQICELILAAGFGTMAVAPVAIN